MVTVKHNSECRRRQIFCTGITPLINLCCSGLINNLETITYIHFENVYDVDKYHVDASRVAEFAELIARFFGYKLRMLGPYKWCIAPWGERMGHKEWHEEVNVEINNGDLITANFLGFIQKQSRGKKIDVFPEGASCFALLNRTYNYNKLHPNVNSQFIWKFRIKPMIRKIRDILYRRVQIRKAWVLPDMHGSVVKLIPKRGNIEVLSIDTLLLNYKRIAFYLADKFPEFDFRKSDAIYFHPVIFGLDEASYRHLVIEIKNKIGSNKIIIKKHPSDNRNLENIFFDLNAVWLSDDFRHLPAELIFAQCNLIYCGYLSTILLFVDKKHLIFTIPQNKGVVDSYENEYDSLRYILNIGRDGFC
jgi:hypothetical protein